MATTVVTPAATPSGTESPNLNQSAGEILDRLQAESQPATVTPTQDAPSTDTTDGQPATPAEETTTQEQVQAQSDEEITQPEEAELEEASPESGNFGKFKDTYKTHPELRSIVGRESAFSELFPKFSEAKQIREWFPTLEDAETMVQEAQSHRDTSKLFREDPEKYLDTLKSSDQLAYSQLILSLPQILSRMDQDTYAQHARTYSHSVLNQIAQFAHQNQNAELLTAVQRVAMEGLGVQLGGPVFRQQSAKDNENPELTKLRAEKAEREKSDRDGQITTFKQTVESEYSEQVLGEIESMVKKSLPTVSEAQLKRIVPEIWQRVRGIVTNQPQTKAQIMSALEQAEKKGKHGLSDQKLLTDYLVRRAKAVLPLHAKAVIEEWSKQVLSMQQSKTSEKKQVAERTKDVGGGAGAGAGVVARPNTSGRRTEGSILDDLAAGRYQRP